MQQIANYSPGGIVYLRTSRNLITAHATLRMRIMQKNVEPNIETSCLYPGGKIKATVLEIMHVDPVGPEPGVGYDWSSKDKRHISCRTIDPGCLSNPKHAITGDPVGFTTPEKEVTLFKN